MRTRQAERRRSGNLYPEVVVSGSSGGIYSMLTILQAVGDDSCQRAIYVLLNANDNEGVMELYTDIYIDALFTRSTDCNHAKLKSVVAKFDQCLNIARSGGGDSN